MLPRDWTIERFADLELLATSEGCRRVVEREQAGLRQRTIEAAAERARRG